MMKPGKKRSKVIVLGNTVNLDGFLRFKETLCIQGKFKGTIEATGALIVDRGAVVDTDHISVTSLTVHGSVSGQIRAMDKIDMLSGSQVRGDISASRLRIADGVLFEGQCSMTGAEREVEIFSRPIEEIRSELQKPHG
ncbi:MAG: polymer-forming cytoskeletal protein [Spirochaetaceae bacterium]|jgi:cytoskeletal protein CcmA (bactofilin family)|nr:polymer-forming cytoskeletal protein [Spirochaetaceae bacterium]